MILCPNCLNKEMIGAIFCSECGARLVINEGPPTEIITGSFEPIESQSAPGGTTKTPPPPPAGEGGAWISLNIISTGDILPIIGRSEFTLGRVNEGQPIIPDIDLTPYKAYESGVSRMHAFIKVEEDQVSITDLGSANGTRINGMQITAQIPYPIKHGDILTLGKFKIQVLMQPKSR